MQQRATRRPRDGDVAGRNDGGGPACSEEHGVRSAQAVMAATARGVEPVCNLISFAGAHAP